MSSVARSLVSGLLAATLAGCAGSADKYSFVRYGQPQNEVGGYDPHDDSVLTDRLALNYSGAVASILRSKYQRSRVTREASSTAQIVLAGIGGAGAAAFGYSPQTLAVLGLGSAGIPELQRIFGARERAQIYQDAVRLIEEAQVEYLAYNPSPFSDRLTQNGVTLFQRVTASLHVVEKTLAGNLPTIQDMEKATERMSEKGALASRAGLPAFNLHFASGDPPMARSDVARFSGVLHSEVTVTAPPSAPPVKTRFPPVRLTGPLRQRSIALQTAWAELTPTLMRNILVKQKIAGAADLPDDQLETRLAMRVLDLEGIDIRPQERPAVLLGDYRRSLSDEKAIKHLEDRYREMGIVIPLVEDFDLEKANEQIIAGFEALEARPDLIKPYLVANKVDNSEALAALILESSGLSILTPKTAAQSLRAYRIKAGNDVFIARMLLKALQARHMPVPPNPTLH